MITIVNSGIGAYLDGNAYVKALILGEPGAGKTRSASFWPKPIFANCERKSMSLLDRNVATVSVGSLAQMDELLLLLRMEGQKPQLERKWSTFVVDTFDAFQRTLITERLTKMNRDKFINEDWNWLGTKTSGVLERIANLPMHVVINVHVKDVTEGDGDDRVIKQKLHLKADIKDQLPAEFDLVGFMESYWSVEDKPDGKPGEREKLLRRRIQWTQDERHPVLKDCSGQLGVYTDVDFTDADFTRIWEPIMDRLDSLPASTEQAVDLPEQSAEAEPVAPVAGGPIATPEAATAAAAPPKRAPAKKAAPAKAAVPPTPAPAAPSPAPVAVPPAPVSTPPSSGGSTTEAASEAYRPMAEPESGAPAAPPESPTGNGQTLLSSLPVGHYEPPGSMAASATPVAVVPDQAPEDDVAEAQASLASEGVETAVVSEAPRADAPPHEPQATASDLHCGDGEGNLQGCGRSLADLSTKELDRTEISYLRWRVRLCPEDFIKAKNGQLPTKTSV